MKRVTRVGLAVVGLGLLALLLSGYWPRPAAVEVARVERGPLRVEVEEDGRVRVQDRFTVSAPLLGVVDRIDLRPGDAVEAGQVLVRMQPLGAQLLDPRTRATTEARAQAAEDAQRQAQAAVQRAEQALARDRRELARLTELARVDAAPRQQLEQAQSTFRLSESELASARFAAQVAAHTAEEAQAAVSAMARPGAPRPSEQVTITAPVRGRVLKVLQESEAAVTPGTPLLEVGDPHTLEVVVDLLTADAVRVRPGQPATLERWGGEQPLVARVRRVEPSAFTKVSALGVEEQRVNAVLDLEGPPEALAALGDGYSVEARIVVWEQGGVLQVPASAVFRHGPGWAAYRVSRGRAELRPVELGQRAPLRVQVSSGLAEGDTVVVHPGEQVRDGARVEVARGP